MSSPGAPRLDPQKLAKRRQEAVLGLWKTGKHDTASIAEILSITEAEVVDLLRRPGELR